MANPQTSPISQLLNSLGMTREDLNKKSDQMRQFLTADSTGSRVFDAEQPSTSKSPMELRSSSQKPTPFASLARSSSQLFSSSQSDASPPSVPVKTEAIEPSLPQASLDTMEAVLERQRLARKEKKRSKAREQSSRTSVTHHSPPPSNASQKDKHLENTRRERQDSLSQSEPNLSNSTKEGDGSQAMMTPQQAKYYREHTASQTKSTPIKQESPTPAARHGQVPQPQIPFFPYPYTMPYYPVPFPPVSMPFLSRAFPSSQTGDKSPLPPSSPPESSPMSSPERPIVNAVSSPGPMNTSPQKPDMVPYKLPPGPYSDQKPDYSYAALIGQAILSSKEHRLTLQEIYDWITTVYPFFKRGETTWMNSIRHVLSTTVSFRKVIRERTLGRTLWAIWDEDLTCFKGGGYRKQASKPGSSSSITNSAEGKRKRLRKEPDSVESRKRIKREDSSASIASTSAASASDAAFLVPVHQPLFMPLHRTSSHHQPYHESCVAPLPTDIMFPPLPIESTSRQTAPPHVTAEEAKTATQPSSDENMEPTQTQGPDSDDVSPSSDSMDHYLTSSPWNDSRPSAVSSDSIPSVPDLTPSRSSSSPVPTSELDTLSSFSEPPVEGPGIFSLESSVAIKGLDMSDDEEEGERYPGDNLQLTPVRSSWVRGTSIGKAGKGPKGVIRGVKLKFTEEPDQDSSDDEPMMGRLLQKKVQSGHSDLLFPFPDLPPSPTPNRRSTRVKDKKARGNTTSMTASSNNNPKNTRFKALKKGRIPTPPPPQGLEPPQTPPRRSNKGKTPMSPFRSPVSLRGQMSPSASLLHYKTHLDPPPPLGSMSDGEDDLFSIAKSRKDDDDDDNIIRTPSRKRNSQPFAQEFNTPRKQLFPSSSMDSPFRTPGLGLSPFRAGIYDPHDPMAMLDEELRHKGMDSPAGLYGKSKGALLYDSPSRGFGQSPGKWKDWW